MNTRLTTRSPVPFCGLAYIFLLLLHAHAQTIDLRGAQSKLDDDKLVMRYTEFPKDGKIEFPRLFNPIRQVYWQPDDPDLQPIPLSIEVLPASWILKCDAVPNSSMNGQLIVEVVGRVQLKLEQAIRAEPDGSFNLKACSGITLGKMLRYEPQPHKNTVGYWTRVDDRVRWPIEIDRAGEFTIGILQGCGAGQGGSKAAFRLTGPVDPKIAFESTEPSKTVDSEEFEVIETGHFQNFQWRHIGQVTVTEPGIYFAEAVPIQIAKAALMDIRCIQLNRNP